jgi:2-methylcitrate dehydratase PrpD
VRIPDVDLKNVDQDMPDVSMPHLIAMMLLDGNVTFRTTHDYKRMKDPKILDLRKRCIETTGDPALRDPQRRWRAAVEVRLKDGRTYSHQTLVAKGCPENPLSRAEQEAKAVDLMGPVLGQDRSRKLVAVLFDIERQKNMRALRRLYAA